MGQNKEIIKIMNKEILQQYANLKEQEAVIAAEITKLGPLILAEISAAGVDKVEAKDVGTFTVAKRKTWKFSEDITLAEEGLEELKRTEKANGVAKATEKPYLLFKGVKEE